MISLSDLTTAYEEGKVLFQEAIDSDKQYEFRETERYGNPESNTICLGDNLDYMVYLLKEKDMAGKIQLIYVDPPFFSSGKYQASLRLESKTLGNSSLMKIQAYDDMWSKGMTQYLSMLTARLLAMKELLSDKGCIWIHLDWHGVYYAKVIMDQIFGENNFINEIVWTYKSGGSSKRSFAKKHDTLLVYGKSGKYKFNPLKEKSYNRGLKPYRFKGVEEFCDDVGWYTLVNMKDVWSIDMVGRTSSERTGYATQKPEKLMERIIASCTDEGDLCADFFAGSGTFGAVCRKMNRNWIMCDEGELSVAGQVHRAGSLDSEFVVEKAQNDVGGIVKYNVSGGLVRLLSYEGQLPQGLDEYTEELGKYMNGDSLCMVKCWSAGTKDDNGVHEADKIFSDSWGIYETDNKTELSVMGYDVFGRTIIGIREE